jgi:hypothetical protein
VPISPTLSVTVQVVPSAVPHENVAFADVGFVMTGVPFPHVADHWSVPVPPLPGVVTDPSAEVSGG